MIFKLKGWKDIIKILTIISGFVIIINLLLNLFSNINIAGVGPISLGMFLFGQGLKEVNLFRETKEKFSLIVGTTLIIMLPISIYVGVGQIQNFH